MTELVAGNVTVRIEDAGASINIDWEGESDARDPGTILSPVFAELRALSSGKAVHMSFRDLHYMNSSSVTPIMALLRELNDSASSVTVRYRSDVQWQATSFRAMRVVARKWSNVTVLGE